MAERNEKSEKRGKFQKEDDGMLNKLIAVNRVTKVVKGGRTMRLSALVAVGDGNGNVGIGMGKAAEVPEAIKKATADAKRNMINIKLIGTTIPHEVIGEYGSGKVVMMPAEEGTGVIAGGPARSVLELAGIKNIRTKSLGSNNKTNVVLATLNGLCALKTPEEVAKLRGKSVDEILG